MDLDALNIGDFPDEEIATRMRSTNYEKFKTLVRMHLSFELDLNTDEFDLPCHEIVYEDKGKLKKWNRLSKKQQHKTGGGTTTGCGVYHKSGSASAGNSPTDGLQQQIDSGFLFHLEELKAFLLQEKNLTQEGIFRKTGSASRQNELRLQIQNDKPLDLECGGYTAHDCATVFKGYLAELPEPLLTDAHYPAHLQIAPLCLSATATTSNSNTNAMQQPPPPPPPERFKREQHLLNSMQLLLLLLPAEHRQLMQHIIEMLHAVAAHSATNLMSAENLATLFAPHLICPRNLPPEALHYVARKMSSIIAYMIRKGSVIFEVPAKLSTDIRAYLMERKRKKTMSPALTLDDSISDMSTVNTVYTFVDREKTAAAHTANNTDTELAQLYAHIQSLPESSKKRRLIKQFNKQNGQGTPLQLVVMNRLKNSEATRSAKSIGDSIKKHIFHKGIMSRTPKRTHAPLPNGGMETPTPTYAPNKNPKLRVLFQSPAPTTSSASYLTASSSSVTTACTSSFSTNCSTSAFSSTSSAFSSTSTTTNSSVSTNNRSSSCTASSSLSSSTTLHTNISTSSTPHTSPFIIKKHPLQKSISSSSLLMQPHLLTPLPRGAQQQRNFAYGCSSNSSSSTSSAASSCSGDGFATQSIKSAPVSRQTSSDLNAQAQATPTSNFQQLLDPSCCVTPLKLITEAAKQLIGVGGNEKKTVGWDVDHLLDITEISNPCTPINQCDFKTRYKSEPNLSRMLREATGRRGVDGGDDDEDDVDNGGAAHQAICTPIGKSKSLTRKLMKGVSMGNLKFPFSTPDTTKRLIRSVSTTLKRHNSDDDADDMDEADCYMSTAAQEAMLAQQLDLDDVDLDDDTFEDNPADHIDDDDDDVDDADDMDDDDEDDVENDNDDEMVDDGMTVDVNVRNDEVDLHHLGLTAVGSSSSSCSSELPAASAAYQHLLHNSSIYRNLDLITSTPSLLLGRRSMSPITKSTQRMPKAMQESIMTPRSRKPVMLLNNSLAVSTDQNQTIYQNDLSSFREQDEEDSLIAGATGGAGAVATTAAVVVATLTETLDHHEEAPLNHNENALDGYADLLSRRRQQQLDVQDNKSFVQQQTEQKIQHQNTFEPNVEDEDSNGDRLSRKPDDLTYNFKEYLLKRSVLTASPVDSSFSSQPDDFGAAMHDTTQDIEDLNESQLNESLLYCLDGFKPVEVAANNMQNDLKKNQKHKNNDEDEIDVLAAAVDNSALQIEEPAADPDRDTTAATTCSNGSSSSGGQRFNRLSTNPFIIVNNARKRAATSEQQAEQQQSKTKNNFKSRGSPFNVTSSAAATAGATTTAAAATATTSTSDDLVPTATTVAATATSGTSTTKDSNKENFEHLDAYLLAKKLLISEFAGETSF